MTITVSTGPTGREGGAGEVGPEVNVNGRVFALGATAHVSALDWLRDIGLTGCKEGCAEGECGACAVLVARPDTTGADGTEWVAINACLIPAASLDGQEVVTAEGLGAPSALHPVQAALAATGGSQCGYCTPGFVCSMAAEYYRAARTAVAAPEAARAPGTDMSAADGADPNEPGAEADAEHGPNGFDLHALSGNLCRCTGYRPIRDAAFGLGAPAADDVLADRRAQQPPPARATRVRSDGYTPGEFVRPTSLAEALQLLADRPEAVVVAGCTDWGVDVNLRGVRAPLVVALDRLPELRELTWEEDVVRLGAALTLTELERRLAGRVPLLSELFPQFASRLIRNGATLGGNLGTASPIGDAPPALLALEARLVLASPAGEREVALADYFTGYRSSVRAAGELLKEVLVPLPLASLAAFHKIAKRRFDDISSVAVAFALDVVDGEITRACIGLGGVAATPVRAYRAEEELLGRPWREDTVARAARALAGEGTPHDDHRASAAYRAAMLGASLRKLYARNPTPPPPASSSDGVPR